MCGRYYLVSRKDELEARFDLTIEKEYTPNYNTAPQQQIYIIPNEQHVVHATWGFPLQGRVVINARVESAQEKALFSSALTSRRCLVIANGFIEWKHEQPFKIAYKHSIITFAGLWENKVIDGKEQMCCVILTTDAVGEMKKYHTRMPLALSKQDEKTWLTTQTIPEVLAPVSFLPLDKKIGNVRNNKPELLIPLRQL
jgi:putative SOS response-associated peptidase YedK